MASLLGTRRLFSTASRLQSGLRNPYVPSTGNTMPFPIRPGPAVTLTPEQEALKQKEKGSWKDLTLEEKKDLYRMSFPNTIVEERTSRGEGRWVLGTIGCWLSFSFLLIAFSKRYLNPKLPYTYTKEWIKLNKKARMPPTIIH